MTAQLRDHTQWVAAGPLWKQAAKSPELLRRPTLLGFPHDNFMDELLAQLAASPEAIAARVASGTSPSYREREPGEAYGKLKQTAQLKLYQPMHGWFYLVAGSLVCQLPGLPDRRVDLAAGEKTGFVLRRLRGADELALVVASDGTKAWRVAPLPEQLVEHEELLPLFPLGFQESERRRRMFAGLIPAGSQDALQAAALENALAADGKPSPADALEDVKGRVTGALKLLIAAPPAQEQATEISRFILLDLADFLLQFVPSAWNALKDGSTPGGAAGQLVSFLRDHYVDAKSWAQLVKDSLAPLAAPFAVNLAHASASILAPLEAHLKAALEAESELVVDDLPVEEQSASNTRYVARLVYQRPLCAPFLPNVVSPPSEPFVLAPHFDADAPGRPIRIALPLDPSIKGLRQFRKNVKLVLSDALRKKVAGIGVIKGDVEGPGFDCGGLSLSIPIITICAMIILFIFLNLLNIVFWWLPFVKICFPKLKVEV